MQGSSNQSGIDLGRKVSRGRLWAALIMAASGIGASDIVSATIGGAKYGLDLLWVLLLGALCKFALSEGLARWQLATGSTVMQGWASHLPRAVLWGFAGYMVLWSIAVAGALISGCGLALENISNGAIPRQWAGVLHAVAGYVLVAGVRTRGFESMMKPLIGVMFPAIVLCGWWTVDSPGAVLRGLFVPEVSGASTAYVLSLMGGVGGSVTLLCHSYLLAEDGRAHPGQLRAIRADLVLAYAFTAIFAGSVMLIANRVFRVSGISITDREAVSRMAGELALLLGPWGFYVYGLGFWAAVIASLVGVWKTVPEIICECWRLLARRSGHDTSGAGREGIRRWSVGVLAAVSIPFAILGRPLLVIVVFTVLGSLFIPFLAGSLLLLNNRVVWPGAVPHNGWLANTVLGVVLGVFLIIGALEVWELVR